MWFQLLKLWLLRSFTLRNFIEEIPTRPMVSEPPDCEALRFATSLRNDRLKTALGADDIIAKLYASQLH